ncbi:ABC transporter G family member 25 [Salmo salar]|uniref:ABC transporter G family member 25 n=1 Tax=Salmo salar TaxID=8030 RepID=A0ABM3DKJ5_SALSA|nr:ABC transporter G family member 25-like [Salmo salar]
MIKVHPTNHDLCSWLHNTSCSPNSIDTDGDRSWMDVVTRPWSGQALADSTPHLRNPLYKCANFKGDVCPKGFYCPVGSAYPQPCDTGFYCGQTGLEAPSGLCTPGYFCSRGSTTPHASLCPPGHYCPQGTPLPLSCPPGTLKGKKQKH